MKCEQLLSPAQVAVHETFDVIHHGGGHVDVFRRVACNFHAVLDHRVFDLLRGVIRDHRRGSGAE